MQYDFEFKKQKTETGLLESKKVSLNTIILFRISASMSNWFVICEISQSAVKVLSEVYKYCLVTNSVIIVEHHLHNVVDHKSRVFWKTAVQKHLFGTEPRLVNKR